MSLVTEVTRDELDQEVLREPGIVVVDVWGPRCGPCLQLMPVVEKLAAEWAPMVRVVKLNSQTNAMWCVRRQVLGLPTFLMFKDGKEQARLSGDVTPGQLETFFREAAQQASGDKQ
ncbi:MAG: thioredoxin family protein [Firmicutes bacterium]|nr:thioredoxin family protein [Bacillota bacterium]